MLKSSCKLTRSEKKYAIKRRVASKREGFRAFVFFALIVSIYFCIATKTYLRYAIEDTEATKVRQIMVSYTGRYVRHSV